MTATVFTISTQPGVRRDGTTVDGNFYSDGTWVRFQRGRPKKIRGYRRITNQIPGVANKMLVWSRQDINSVYSFCPSSIEVVSVDSNGLGSAITFRTPSGYTEASNVLWSADTQYDAAGGTAATIVVAHASSSGLNIDDGTGTKPYWATATGTTLFAKITDAPLVSGGVFSIAPYTVLHGSDGFISWSDVNQPQVWSTSTTPGDAGTARITGSKIVKGLPLRSGSGPAALLWSQDSVIKMEYIGGNAIFRFSTMSSQTSILAQNSVIEYDGIYFWIGTDRFLTCSTSVQELPNSMNQNYFFDNLNYTYRQKIWAIKVPRFGEIWWFYPRGTATECSHAIIFNIREKTWYDVELPRSSGFYSQTLHFPIMAGNFIESDSPTTYILQPWTRVTTTATVTRVAHGYVSGAVIRVSVSTSEGAIVLGNKTITVASADTFTFTCLNAGDASGTLSFDTVSQSYGLYVHEQGTDAVVGDNQTAIVSSFTTSNFGFPTGGMQDSVQGVDNWTRLTRVEPDFLQTGDMQLQVLGYEFASSTADTITNTYDFTPDDGKIDMREQHRYIQLKFTSNTAGGDYEMGKVIVHAEIGDLRS